MPATRAGSGCSLILRRPWSSRCMPDMNDSDGIRIDDPIENLVSIPRHDSYADVGIAGSLGSVGSFANGSNAVMDGAHDIVRAAGISLLQILKDIVNIGEGARTVDDAHSMPWRFQKR